MQGLSALRKKKTHPGNEAGEILRKSETRLCGHAVRGGCSLFALNKQEAVRCVQKADGIQQAGMGWQICV